MFKKVRFALMVFSFTCVALCNAVKAEDFNTETATGMAVLQKWYSGDFGIYNTTGWWNSANVLEVTIDYMRYSGSNAYLPTLDRTYTTNHSGNFLNNFYDDEGWWALAWVKAYDFTGNVAYLDQAKTIFNDMAAAWDTSKCGGGIWWSKDKNYKASIANELFFLLAARLHNRTPGDTNYLNWATKEWNWFKGSGLLRSNNTIQDGLHTDCSINTYTASYNQGVILGALVELNKANGDASLLTTATNIANATVNSSTYSPNGILKEPCGGGCTSADLPQFDGIFMRNLKVLADKTNNASYRTYMTNNAHSIWANDRNGSNQFGVDWSGPFDKADAARQSSALDALNTQVTNASPLQNVAVGKSGSSNGTACSTGETAANALNGSLNNKWCQAGGGGQSMTVDLGSSQSIAQFVVYHAESGSEDSTLNTKDFNIQTSTDNSNWSTRVTVTGNTGSITTHNISTVTARYVRLNIVTAQSSSSNQSARIYEFQVMATGAAPPPPPVKHEAESLPVAGFSGDVERVAADTGYSGGNGVILEGNAVNDFVTFTVNVATTATYNVQVAYKTGTNRSIWQLSTDGTNHGGVVDGYSTSGTFPVANLGNVSLTAGNHAFKFNTTGKNGNSSAYWMAIDYILLTPQ